MKKIYDKVILLVVIILLLATGFVALTQYNAVKSFNPELPVLGEVLPYEPIKVNQSVYEQEMWPEPSSQREDGYWKYSVFTPPKIYIGDNGEYVATPPDEEPPEVVEPPKVPFGVVLVDMKRDVFRFEYSSFSGSVENARISVRNVETDKIIQGRVGETIDEEKIKFVSFKEERVERNGEYGTEIIRVAKLVLRDLKSGNDYTLTSEESEKTIFTGLLTVTIASQSNPEEIKKVEIRNFELKDKFETLEIFKMEGFNYKLQEIYFIEDSVQINKVNLEDGTSHTIKLSKGVMYEINGEIMPNENSENKQE
jgi:hypothetical protein